jgi:hypothetical protein
MILAGSQNDALSPTVVPQMQMGLDISSPGESISEPKMVMPPMATGNMQSQQMSVIGLKKFAEQVARPVPGQARIRAIAAITRKTGSLARKNIPPLEGMESEGILLRACLLGRRGATEQKVRLSGGQIQNGTEAGPPRLRQSV